MKILGPCAAAAIFFAQAASAEEAGALVIDVVGDVSPAVGAFEDVAVGTKFVLTATAELTISHYSACEELTVRGGEVQVLDKTLELVGSEVVDRVQVDCPEAIALAAADTASATVVVRNFSELPKVPLSPSIVLVGASADDCDTFTLLRDNNKIVDLEIRDRQVVWPEAGLYLSDRTKYSVSLTGPGGEFGAEIVADKRTSARVVLRP